MKPKEITVGGYYVREEKNTIMHFYSAGSDGLARYHAYDVHDGKFTYTSSCYLGTMMQWAERKATVEEISRLHRDIIDPPQQGYGMFERRPRALRQALRATKG